jgi:Uma2 family endonuclease
MSAVLPLARHKLSVEDYHRMGEAGIFAPGERVELIEGEVIDMAPIGSVHVSVVNTLSRFFILGLGDSGIVSTQNSIRLLPNNEPQPDVVILKPRVDRYRSALPTAADVLLLIEVADTSAGYDRGTKIPLYARFGIREVWLIDLNAGRLEVYSDPASGGYRSARQFGRQDSVTPGLIQVPALPLVEIWPAA